MQTELINQHYLFQDICQIIDSTKREVASRVNSELTLMYWHIGHRINTEILDNKRAEYGKHIVASLSLQLEEHFCSKEFGERNFRRMMQFAQEFPDIKIVTPLVSQLSWTHFIEVFPLKDTLQREFYITMAASERWSKRTLKQKIDGMLYERTLLSRKPDELDMH